MSAKMKITDLYQELTEISARYKEKSHVTVVQKKFMDDFLDTVQNAVADLSPTQNLLYAATTGLHEHIDLNLLHLDKPFMKKYLVEAKKAVLGYIEKKQNTLKRYGDIDAAMAGAESIDYKLEKRIEKELRQEVHSLSMSNKAKDKAENRALEQKAEIKERLQGSIKRRDKKVMQLKQGILGLEEQVGSYKSEVEVKVKEVRELEVTVKNITGQNETVQSQAEKANAQVKSLQEKVKELEKNYKALEKKYDFESKSYKAVVEKQKTEVAKYKVEVTKQKQEVKKQKDEVKKQRSEVRKYKSENTRKNKEIRQAKKDVKDMQKEKKSLEVTLTKTEKEVEKANAKILEKSATIRSIKGTAGYYERERKKTEKELISLKQIYDKDIQALQETLDTLEQNLEERKKDAGLVKQLQQDNAYLKQEADKVKPLQDQLKEAEKKYNAGDSQKMKDLEKEVTELKKQNAEHERQHEADAKLLEETYEKHEKDIEELTKKQPAEPETPAQPDTPAEPEPQNPAEPETPAEPEIPEGMQRPTEFPKKKDYYDDTEGYIRPPPPEDLVEGSKKKKDKSGLEKKVDDKDQKHGANIINIDALHDLHALVYALSENGTTAEKRKAYETFLKYASDPVVKAAVYNNLGCIYSKADKDFSKAREYYQKAVDASEKAAELELDISTERLQDYKNNLYICESKIRLAGRPALKDQKKPGIIKRIFSRKKAV